MRTTLALLLAQAAAPLAATTSFGADSTIVAAAIVTVIAALVGGTVSVINAASSAADRRASRQERLALMTTTSATDRKADTIIEKAVEIHTLTNSNLAKVTAALDIANERIHGLEKLMAQMLASTNAAAMIRARAEQPPGPALTAEAEPMKVEVVNRIENAEPVKVEVVNTPLVTTTTKD